MKYRLLLVLASVVCCRPLFSAELDVRGLEAQLSSVAESVRGRLGACVSDGKATVCVRGGARFPLQSVMKLPLAIAVLDAVDRNVMRIDGPITVRREDLSVFVQPIAARVGPSGYSTTVGELLRGSVIDSDNAATDTLIDRLGGPAEVQRTLTRLGIRDVRVDRDERHLQSDILGFEWKLEYADPARFQRARAAVPDEAKTQAYNRYLRDDRDTATPEAMAEMLWRLHAGRLLSKSSTAFLMQALLECRTGANRLKAGLPAGWRLAHKTGSSGSWQGVTAATNDSGLIMGPKGVLAVSVFVADSRADEAEREAAIAKVASAAVAHFR